jgi:hypothetical protein
MVAEGIKYTRKASPLHVSPTPEIRAALTANRGTRERSGA